MREFSRLIGYSEPAVHHWMYGLCEMRISTFANVVDVLQLSATEKPYYGSKAVDRSCRNHGNCPWCKENRLHKFRDKKPMMEEDDGKS